MYKRWFHLFIVYQKYLSLSVSSSKTKRGSHTVGPAYNEQINSQKSARYKWYSLHPNFSNIDVNQKSSSLWKNSACSTFPGHIPIWTIGTFYDEFG